MVGAAHKFTEKRQTNYTAAKLATHDQLCGRLPTTARSLLSWRAHGPKVTWNTSVASHDPLKTLQIQNEAAQCSMRITDYGLATVVGKVFGALIRYVRSLKGHLLCKRSIFHQTLRSQGSHSGAASVAWLPAEDRPQT